jgi:DNA-binding NarL/FixJ family response regulator
MNIKLLLVDDHPMLRRGLAQTVAQTANFVVAGEASSGAEALKLVQELGPDLIVMDVHLPDLSGIEASRQILTIRPLTKVIIFSSDGARSLVDQALQAGVCGYVLKGGIVDELVDAIHRVMDGKLYLSPELTTGILEDYRKQIASESVSLKTMLSERERELLRLVAEGQRNKEIAGQLGIGVKSVEAYRSRLMKKLNCSSLAELVRYAIREGVVTA